METYRNEAQDIGAILARGLAPIGDHLSPIDGTDCPNPLTYDNARGTATCEVCGFYSDPFEGLEV